MVAISNSPVTEMFNSKSTDTIQLSDTVLKLDALYASYDSILSEVKAQLESLDVTDEQISRISTNLCNNNLLREKVACKAVTDLAGALAEASQENIEGKKQLEGLVEALSSRVMDKISEVLNTVIETTVQARLKEVYTDEKLEELIVQFLVDKPGTITAFKAQDCLEMMLQVLGYQKVEPITDQK